MKKINPIYLLLLGAAFFVWPSFCFAGVIISELAWMGTEVSANDEWIELYNLSDAELDLTGWVIEAADGTPAINLSGKISADEYFLLERTDDETVPGILADQIYAGALGNTGETLQLKDAGGNIIFQFDAGAGWPAGDNETKQTISYDGTSWKNSAASGGTPKAANNFAAETPPVENQETSPTEIPAAPPETTPAAGAPSDSGIYRPGDILINEFVADPSDADEGEWIELYNKTASAINITGWKIEEGSESATKLAGTISGRSFFVIEKPKGNLNNTGDVIILYDAAGEIIDQVTYGDWQDDNLSDNAPAASDPSSVARITDGYDTNNDFTNFKITATPTKDAANIITATAAETAKQQYSQSIIINEIFPNPVGADDDEFIEIKNIGSSAVSLDGWKLGDASTRRFTISGAQIEAGAVLLFSRSETGIALNNSGTETVALYYPRRRGDVTAPSDEIADEIQYSGTAPENKSFSRDSHGDWLWSSAVTPGQENEIIKENEAPVAMIFAVATTTAGTIITFDGSDSVDPEGGKLKYFWDFGDGRIDEGEIVRQIYARDGEYTVLLKVIDEGSASSTAKHMITVGEGLELQTQEDMHAPEGDVTSRRLRTEEYDIFISEFLPNPAGSDAELEFVELFNPNNFAVDLSGWILDDAEGGSAPYVWPDSTFIEAFQYLLLPRPETEIALNNNGDEVRLFDAAGNLIDLAVYEKSAEGISIIRDEQGILQNTKTQTPGEINVLVEAGQAAGMVMATISDLAEEELNTPVKVSGAILVPPGILGTQIFYIGGSQGIQVYMYKKDFPELRIGDKVEVSGILTQSQGERRIKIAAKEDIKLLGARTEVKPLLSLSSQINEQLDAGLITVSGEVTESKGSGFWVDDGDGEVYVYIKSATGIKKNFKVGDTVSVTGILTHNETGFRILPRFAEDILVQKVLAAETGPEDLQSSSAGGGVNKYLIATIAALLIIVAGMGWKLKKSQS